MKVFNSAGELVYQPSGPLYFYHQPSSAVALGGPFVPDANGTASFQLLGAGQNNVVSWDGRNQGGQWVAGGTYQVVFQGQAPDGTSQTLVVTATVIRQQSASTLAIYNSAGELVRHFSISLTAVSGLVLSAQSLVPGKGSVGIQVSTSPTAAVSWDGLNDQGQRVAGGLYQVKLVKEDPGASSDQFSAWIQVINAPSSLLEGLAAGPNPVAAGQGSLEIRLPALDDTAQVQVGLYALDGELVEQNAASGNLDTLPLPHGIAGGVYLLVVQARDHGLAERKVIKIAVIR